MHMKDLFNAADYLSFKDITVWIQWCIAVGGVIFTFRGAYTIYSMSTSPDESISGSAILKKVANIIKAIVIIVIVEALIELVKGYYFHS